MKKVVLTKGYVALVDNADFERVEQFKWRAHVYYKMQRKQGRLCIVTPREIVTVYAVRSVRKENGKRETQSMHRLILGITDPKIEGDHVDHNGLNNQRDNLRKCTSSQNHRNRRKTRGSSKFKGVRKHRDGKWEAVITLSRPKYLGLFTGELDAAKAYDAAARKHFGEFAFTNL